MVVGCAMVVVTVACGGPSVPAASAPAASPPTPPVSTATPFATAAPMTETIDYAAQLENFEAATFSDSARIDNAWYPLLPGTQFVYEGFTEEAGQRIPHKFVQTVTDLTKTIMGVRTVVVWDQDFKDGELVEAELAFSGQSDSGEVWRMGEYPEVYEQGKIVETPTWIAGIAGARPGITMKKDPQLGTPSYSQGWAPEVPWTDRARIGQVGVKDCVPSGCYENGIAIEEFNREEPDAIQLKFYARGMGNTRVAFTGADATRETLELISVSKLDPAALADARSRSLALEESGFARSKDVYALTTPVEQRTAGS
jgi:hypothetical protein